MANKKISYTTRDFESIRTELINFTKPIFFNLEDLPQAESILLSGDVSLIEEESI